MRISLNQLKEKAECERKGFLGSLGLEMRKGDNYDLSIAIREVIKRGKTSIETLDSLIADNYLVEESRNILIEELNFKIERYLEYLNSLKVVMEDLTINVEKEGVSIPVKIDSVIDHGNFVEVVKIKTGKPKLKYKGRRFDTIPGNDIELYYLYEAALKLPESIVKGRAITASFHHITSSHDEKGGFANRFNSTKGSNIITCNNFSDKMKELVKEVLTRDESISNLEECRACDYCSYSPICFLERNEEVELDVVKEDVEKASDEFSLTSSQREAVLFSEGVMRINAGAGSGKTTIISIRISELLQRGCNPSDILLITFTNKGAEEMREKIKYWLDRDNVDVDVSDLNIMTFNAFGGNIVSKNHTLLGFKENPVLAEKIDKYDIILEILKGKEKIESLNYANPLMNFRYSQGAIIQLERAFDYIKSHLISSPEDFAKQYSQRLMVEDENIGDWKAIYELYEEYNKVLKDKNLIEYQDQVNFVLKLISEYPERLDGLDYSHLIVDEFQDSDNQQMDIIMFLANQPKFTSLMVVGDDSQCQPAGTKVSLPNGEQVNIEDLKVGDKVLSCTISKGYYPKSEEGTKSVKEISTHMVNDLVSIKTEKGKVSEYTPNHRCFARIHLEGNEEKSVIYIMENEKGYFRIGHTRLFVTGNCNFGVRNRMNAEGGVNAWILAVCDPEEAWVTEQICAYKYGIPQTTWVKANTKYVTDESLDELYKNIGLGEIRKRVAKCLSDYNRDIRYPIFVKNTNTHFSKFHVTEIRACNLIPEIMDVAVPKLKGRIWKNSYEQIISVDNIYDEDGIMVYGLDIEDYHTYVADEILTHNSIFGFRNTSQDIILEFKDFFPETIDLNMVDNFRSTEDILNLANSINDMNIKKIDKDLISGGGNGKVPQLLLFKDKDEEHSFIAKMIKKDLDEGKKPQDIAVISRTRAELSKINEELKKLGVPGIVDISEPIVNNLYIHIAIGFSEFIQNTDLTANLFNYMYVSNKDSLKNLTKEQLKDYIQQAKELVELELYSNRFSLIDEEGKLVRDEIALIEDNKFRLFFEFLRKINDNELQFFLDELEEKDFYKFSQLESYLSKFIIYGDTRSIEKDETLYKAVVLTTAHSSKGREWNKVYSTISRFSQSKDDEEERRLLFVVITRAKKELVITTPKYMRKKDKMKNRFAVDIEKTNQVEVINI